MEKLKFTKVTARQVAGISFLYMLDCILGHSDSGYDLSTSGEDFEQNFEEDIDQMGFKPTPYKVGMCTVEYDKMKEGLTKLVNKFNLKLK